MERSGLIGLLRQALDDRRAIEDHRARIVMPRALKDVPLKVESLAGQDAARQRLVQLADADVSTVLLAAAEIAAALAPLLDGMRQDKQAWSARMRRDPDKRSRLARPALDGGLDEDRAREWATRLVGREDAATRDWVTEFLYDRVVFWAVELWEERKDFGRNLLALLAAFIGHLRGLDFTGQELALAATAAGLEEPLASTAAVERADVRKSSWRRRLTRVQKELAGALSNASQEIAARRAGAG